MATCNKGLWRVPEGWVDTGIIQDGRCLLWNATTQVYRLWDGLALKGCDQARAAKAAADSAFDATFKEWLRTEHGEA